MFLKGCTQVANTEIGKETMLKVNKVFYNTGVSKRFWVLPQNIFVYNDIAPLDLKVRKSKLISFKIVAYAMIISLDYIT
jgi:hypothetical protein